MGDVNIGITDVEFGVHLVEDDPGLTLVLFIAFSLLLILGPRFSYYAHRNLAATDIDSQRAIWRDVRSVGLFASAYGAVGILEIISSLTVAPRNALLLATALGVAFAIRQIQAVTNADETPPRPALERLLRMGFVALVFVYVAVAAAGGTRLGASIEAGSALAFFLYGLVFFEAGTAKARLQGTLLDSLLRHLLPVLAFSSLVGVVAVATAFGLDPAIVWHVQVVFIVMTGTALMTATIKLRQNLAGL